MPQTITRVERWRKQEPLFASKLNQGVQAIEDLRRQIAVPTQIVEDGGSRRWFHVKNVDSRTIVGYAMVEITKVVSTKLHNAVEHYEVKRPTADSITGNVMITDGRTIRPGDPGLAGFAFRPMRVNYAGDDPELDDIRGTEEDSFELTSEQAGFKVLGVIDDKDKVAIVREVGSAAAFFKEGTVVKEASPGTKFFSAVSASLVANHLKVIGNPISDDSEWVILALERPIPAINIVAISTQLVESKFRVELAHAGLPGENLPDIFWAGIKTDIISGDPTTNPNHLQNLTWNLAQALSTGLDRGFGRLRHELDITEDIEFTFVDHTQQVWDSSGQETEGPFFGVAAKVVNNETPIVQTGGDMTSASGLVRITAPQSLAARKARGFCVFVA